MRKRILSQRLELFLRSFDQLGSIKTFLRLLLAAFPRSCVRIVLRPVQIGLSCTNVEGERIVIRSLELCTSSFGVECLVKIVELQRVSVVGELKRLTSVSSIDIELPEDIFKLFDS